MEPVLQQQGFFINLLRFTSLRAQVLKILQLLKIDGGKKMLYCHLYIRSWLPTAKIVDH